MQSGCLPENDTEVLNTEDKIRYSILLHEKGKEMI